MKYLIKISEDRYVAQIDLECEMGSSVLSISDKEFAQRYDSYEEANNDLDKLKHNKHTKMIVLGATIEESKK